MVVRLQSGLAPLPKTLHQLLDRARAQSEGVGDAGRGLAP